jgi:hypothetical protein
MCVNGIMTHFWNDNLKTDPDSRIDRNDKIDEKIVAVAKEQLVEMTYEKQKKKFSKKQILETNVYPLLNHCYIDSADSNIDKRSKIFYPIVSMNRFRTNE